MMRGFVALLGLIALSACVSPTDAPAKRSGVAIVPDTLGLQVNPVGKRIDFGRSPKGVIPVLDRELGRREELSLTGCPATITRQTSWGELVLTFTPERFVGWHNSTDRQGVTCI